MKGLFVGSQGIRAGWRWSIYATLLVAAVGGLLRGAGLALHALHISTKAPPGVQHLWVLILTQSLILAAALAATWIMTRIDHLPFADGRLRWSPGRAREFAEGVLWGLCVCVGFVGLIAAMGGYSLGRMTGPPSTMLLSVALWVVAAFINGLGENLAVFGYALSTIERAVGFWPAALGLTLLFTLSHAANAGETGVGLLSIAVQAFFLLVTIRRTGSLWLSVGVHAGGVLAEDCLLSVPDSGVTYTGHLTDAAFHGPAWLTGGSAGPEGSVAAFVVFALAATLFLAIHRGPDPKPR